MGFVEAFFKHYIGTFSNYLFFASVFFILFYLVFGKKWFYKKIQLKKQRNKDYLREFGYSALTIVIFALVGIAVIDPSWGASTKLYRGIDQMPMWYYYLSFPMMMLLHDTYFYWMHRTMHHPKIFKIAHLVHHKSTNPSPWAAYSFHPIEAFFEALILPIIVMVMPVHISAIAFFFMFQIFYNVYGHLGYEIYPKGFNRHWLGKWINTSTHHNLHHKHFDQSYGLYFTFWDRMMGTMHPAYDESFDDISTRVKPN